MAVSVQEVRKMFIEYFQSKNHEHVKSSSLIPIGDPTLLFTNAGMVQFKDVFTGIEKRPYSRAVTVQKCVRAGGKHNDLENVGFTARHHTFFEMLGNFSFGDYFKEEAIQFAWEFLTKKLKLKPEKLYITIFAGTEKIPEDTQAFQIWKTVTGFSDDKIIKLGMKENFWAMGDTGPCGPCTEIHYDQKVKGVSRDFGKCTVDGCGPACDCDRFIEIWNLVFMQYEQTPAGLRPLPKPCVDTGAGLERITAVLNGVYSNYDIDVFTILINKISKRLHYTFSSDKNFDAFIRVVADHARASSFLIADGIIPSNEGRGYVLRRIIRRALFHARQVYLNSCLDDTRFVSERESTAGIEHVYFQEACNDVIDLFKDTYPELNDSRDNIGKWIYEEESKFLKVLARGNDLLFEEIEKIKSTNKNQISGATAFKLYDTYGFPVDLTQLIARRENLFIDMDEYERLMEKQRTQGNWKGNKDVNKIDVYRELQKNFSATQFMGYSQYQTNSLIKAMIHNGNVIQKAEQDQEIEILLDVTPFYGESGGQAGDCGIIIGDGFEIQIQDVKKPIENVFIHFGKVIKGIVQLNVSCQASIDIDTRMRTKKNHSATHLLHGVLRSVLGNHVKQAGSLVAPQRLRFDFSHFEKITDEQIIEIERKVNEAVLYNHPVSTTITDLENARKSGAMMMFDEKYGDRVRMVQMGPASTELCGGTHVTSTGEIGSFKILSESSVAAGVRRIEAITGIDAFLLFQKMNHTLEELSRRLSVSNDQMNDKISKMLDDLKNQEKEIQKAKKVQSQDVLKDIIERAKKITLFSGKEVMVVSTVVPVNHESQLRDYSDSLRDKLSILALGGIIDNKPKFVMSVSKDLTSIFNSGSIVKEMSLICNGKGGGRPDFAQGGGNDPTKIEHAMQFVYDFVHSQTDKK